MTLRVIEESTHVASLVVRPVDALRRALNRPVFERAPVESVRFELKGRVSNAGDVQGFARGAPRGVLNLSGDTVFRDLELDADKYRVALERVRGRMPWYHPLDDTQWDIDWDPTQPPPIPAGELPHRTHVHEVELRPTSAYPYPRGMTLLRAALRWYDDTPLLGAVVTCAAALLPRVPVDESGGFALCFAWNVRGPVTVKLELGKVDPNAKAAGQQYLAAWPAQWPALTLRPTATASVRQAALEGVVVGPDGLPLPDAEVEVLGLPGLLRTDGLGHWRYCFPPRTPDQAVDLEIRHPAYATRPLGAEVRADATVTTPKVQLT